MTPSKAFLTVMGLLLLGYAFFDKGFALLPHAPIFVGELALVAGFMAALSGSISVKVFRSPVSWILLAYVAWGLFVAAPHFSTFGVLTYRDSVVWFYSLFALLVAGALMRSGLEGRVLDWFGRWFPWFVYWAPVAFVAKVVLDGALPNVPGSEVSLLTVKAADLSVHLAGAGAFMLLGLHKVHPISRLKSYRGDFVLWTVWFVGFAVMASKTRGGMLAVLAALFIVFVLRRTKQWPRLVIGAVVASLMSIVVLELAGSTLSIGERKISLDQVFLNAISVVSAPAESGLATTTKWRLDWWGKVIGYTFYGEYVWTGKGFGINLADSDGFQVEFERPLRSPHNGHLTVLARSGVPGITLWAIFILTFYTTMFRRYRSARRRREHRLASINLFVIAYSAAFLVNMSFDVYLEGPQGGIWFWSLVGFGIALSERQKREAARSRVPAAKIGGLQPVR